MLVGPIFMITNVNLVYMLQDDKLLDLIELDQWIINTGAEK